MKKARLNYHFGVINLEVTTNNHKTQLIKYRKAIKEGIPAYKFNVDSVKYGFDYLQLSPSEIADEILGNMNYIQYDYLKSMQTYKSIRMIVNNYFRQNIIFYLEKYNLPKSYNTAVYLQTYKTFNSFMNKVAIQVNKRLS